MPPDTTRPGYVLLFTAGLSAVFTAAVMGVQAVFAGRIERNEAYFEQQAIVRAARLVDEPLTRPKVVETYGKRMAKPETVSDPESGRTFKVYRAYGRDLTEGAPPPGAPVVAVVFPFVGKGTWDDVSGFIALKPDLDEIIGVSIVRQNETPGLGGRITEPAWLAQFNGLDVSKPAEGARYIYVTSDKPSGPRDPRYGRTVDAVTGATLTSNAMGVILHENLAALRRAMEAAPSGAP